MKYTDIKKGDILIVEVDGWIMCNKVKEGKYRIEIKEETSTNKKLACFYKPKGAKMIVCHYLKNIMLREEKEGLNGTRIINYLKKL
jgi:hypothetical protein